MTLARALVAICFFSLAPPKGGADVVLDAPSLLDACTRADMHWIDFCNGYFQAVADATVSAGLACVPAGTSRTQLVEMFERRAVDATDFSTVAGFALASRILAGTFPCQ